MSILRICFCYLKEMIWHDYMKLDRLYLNRFTCSMNSIMVFGFEILTIMAPTDITKEFD